MQMKGYDVETQLRNEQRRELIGCFFEIRARLETDVSASCTEFN